MIFRKVTRFLLARIRRYLPFRMGSNDPDTVAMHALNRDGTKLVTQDVKVSFSFDFTIPGFPNMGGGRYSLNKVISIAGAGDESVNKVPVWLERARTDKSEEVECLRKRNGSVDWIATARIANAAHKLHIDPLANTLVSYLRSITGRSSTDLSVFDISNVVESFFDTKTTSMPPVLEHLAKVRRTLRLDALESEQLKDLNNWLAGNNKIAKALDDIDSKREADVVESTFQAAELEHHFGFPGVGGR
ncbi:hypothetical protein K490DRAFT_64073 [Saccharata proteae CBS 121410]|uniref:Uncharacterized protein n=1 Tax=Saccharata proteae CBS 121410 TaxID=1314787 RepID=A0A6A5YDF0_9PEZI|nr:hypothetical protein K490DRAFT_64073 [Saccharata proteae CBS 121410]